MSDLSSVLPCYTPRMRFSLMTVARYVITAVAVLLFSVVLSMFSVMAFVPASDGSPGDGLLWIFLFVAEAALLVPFSLGLTAELIERKAQGRDFQWLKGLKRFLIAIPISIGPVYALTCVWPYIEDRRPSHWVWNEAALYIVSGAFAYLALRINRKASELTM